MAEWPNPQWRLRQIVLDQELVQDLYSWHGGMSSYTYSLASTGDGHLVSLSMIDAAIGELEADFNKIKRQKGYPREDKQHLAKLIGDLDAARVFWREHSAKEYGLEEQDEGYDRRDYGLSPEEERDIKVHSG